MSWRGGGALTRGYVYLGNHTIAVQSALRILTRASAYMCFVFFRWYFVSARVASPVCSCGEERERKNMSKEHDVQQPSSPRN